MRKVFLAALAASLVLAGTASAGSDAYFSAQYGGWSKEVECWRTNEHSKLCQVLTIGKTHSEAAHLSYMCSRGRRDEWLYFNWIGGGAVPDDDTAVWEARWMAETRNGCPWI